MSIHRNLESTQIFFLQVMAGYGDFFQTNDFREEGLYSVKFFAKSATGYISKENIYSVHITEIGGKLSEPETISVSKSRNTLVF